jgi:N6-L-threonylcarbamoyladenine synthase
MTIILAIETSCDETSAAILKDNLVLSNIISSQLFHTEYGGIVPELASRAHISSIDKITNSAIEKSGIDKKNIDIVAATKGPGLIGSLLVGLNYAKSFAIASGKDFIGINHIESHLYSCYIENKTINFPFIALIVSGGHTILFLVNDFFDYKILGQTQDDAAGEAFDKVAKMLGLGYPGGPSIDKLAQSGNKNFHKFPHAIIKDNKYDFSFSGIKTSVLYYLRKNFNTNDTVKDVNIPVNDICASFQKAVVETLAGKTIEAASNYGVKNIAVSGGVSANSALRKELNKYSAEGYNISFPKPVYSTDNAAMVGYTAYLYSKYSSPINTNKFIKEPAFARFNYSDFK